MKYFLDTEFIEGKQKNRLFGRDINTIDLISIGIVAEDNRKYYAISKDFNLKEAWNRYDEKVNQDFDITKEDGEYNPLYIRIYWLRENVLKNIYNELVEKEYKKDILAYLELPFSYKSLKYLIKKYGKTNKEISEEIIEFVNEKSDEGLQVEILGGEKTPIEFYGYYSDYDWVVFCWLFGKMKDLPRGFPMYCRDLKQILDEKAKRLQSEICYSTGNHEIPTLNDCINEIQKKEDYPKQTNEHNALADAKWNYELYEYLKIKKAGQ